MPLVVWLQGPGPVCATGLARGRTAEDLIADMGPLGSVDMGPRSYAEKWLGDLIRSAFQPDTRCPRSASLAIVPTAGAFTDYVLRVIRSGRAIAIIFECMNSTDGFPEIGSLEESGQWAGVDRVVLGDGEGTR